MTEERIGRQTPTLCVVLPYKKTRGAEAVELYNKTGRTAREWQEVLLYDIMAENDDGLWVHTRYGYEVPRRNGKGEILTMRELWGLQNGERIMHTAHLASTAHNAWERLYALVRAAGLQITSEYRAFGKEHIYVEGGGRIEFRTRTSKGGLGEGYDLLVVDEAQEYQTSHESALKYMVTDSDNPQIIMCGTPPTAVSAGTVFAEYRQQTIQGKNMDAGWAEWSVEQEMDPADTEAWYGTNPSLGLQLSERDVRNEYTGDIVDFNIQRLGLWISYNQASAISRAEWQRMQVDEELRISGKLYVGVKYGIDARRMAASVAVRAGNKVFVEVLFCQDMRKGNRRLLEFLKRADVEKVVVDGKAGQDLLAEEMKKEKMKKPILPKVSEIIVANAKFEQAVESGALLHNGQPSLEEVVSNCEKRTIASTGFGYRSLKPDMEIAIMDSAILAYWAAEEFKEKKKQIARY
ncbi:MAG: terminase [Lachnospiraceae bacterium]|nr:terminase [Lachnospiraceae bacterium]